MNDTTDTPSAQPSATRCGFVAVIGPPNAGKSTLVNRAVGQKISIVSHKVQTTRAIVRGVTMRGTAQLIFVDTPGIFAPKRRLDRAMVAAAWGGAGDADAVLLLADVRKGLDEEAAAIVARLPRDGRPVALVLNKIDTVRPEALLAVAAAFDAAFPFTRVFMISALEGGGVDDLLDWLAETMPQGPLLFPEDELTDMPARLIAAEVTREKIFLRLHQELPYNATVETERFEERRDGSARIEQVIYVTREAHKGIVLGKGGQTVKEIGRLAREELQQILDRPVHLFLFVKVREKWQDDPERYAPWGLDPKA